MAESKPYRLPNVQGVFVTTFLGTGGGIFKIDNDGNRVLYAGYSIEDGKINIPAPTADGAADPGFANALAQGDSNFKNAIQQSVNDARGTTQSQPDPNQPGAPGGSTPTNPNTPQESGSNKPTVQRLTYPSDMSGKQDRIKFTAVEYLATGTFERYGLGTNDPGTLKRKNRVNVRQGTSVFLAIQSSITDNNSVDWQGGNLNEIERRLANASLTYMNEPGKQVVEQVTKDVGKVVAEVAKYSPEIKVALAGEAVGIQNILGRFGTVLNPNLELLFTGPQLRPFTFTFKMSPRSGPEAKEVKDIIKFFKSNMAPIIADGNIFLKAPKTFFIKYEYGENRDGEHPGLNLIKECALTNCSVDYTPNGTYMTYPDGTMVSYSITLQFQELEPVYSDDYNDDQSIGF